MEFDSQQKKSTVHWHVTDINIFIFFVSNTWSWKSVISSISKVHVCLFCLLEKKGWHIIYWLTQELLYLECWWKDTLAHEVWKKKWNKNKSKMRGISRCHFWNLKDVPSIFSLQVNLNVFQLNFSVASFLNKNEFCLLCEFLFSLRHIFRKFNF